MRFLFIRKNRPIFMGLFWIYSPKIRFNGKHRLVMGFTKPGYGRLAIGLNGPEGNLLLLRYVFVVQTGLAVVCLQVLATLPSSGAETAFFAPLSYTYIM